MLTRPYINCDAQTDPMPSWMVEEHYEYCENVAHTAKNRRFPFFTAVLQLLFI